MKRKLLAPDLHKAVSVWFLTIATTLCAPGVYEQLVAVFPEWERYILPAILVARVINQSRGGQV